MAVGFQQAPLAVEKVEEFEELKGAVARALNPETSEMFLKQMRSASLRIRDFGGVLKQGVLERVNKSSKGSALKLYETLPVLDQAQVREFYLSKIEEVAPALRTKFQSLYRYY